MLEKRYSLPASLAVDTQSTENISIPLLRTALGSWRFSIEREPLSNKEITKRYDRKASSWKRMLGLMGYLKAYRTLMHTLFSQGYIDKLPDDPWVLDAGTGSGALSLAFHAAYSEQFQEGNPMFSGIDRSQEMLQIAQRGFDSAELNATLNNFDICHLPWEKQTFDFAMAAHVIEHIPTPEKALAELVRVLQPGASLLLLVTKRSIAGALVQMNWRVHGLGREDLYGMLKGLGLTDIRFIPLKGILCRQMSIACIARKRHVHPALTLIGNEVNAHG